MLIAFRNLGLNMSIKMNVLLSDIDSFPENLEPMSDEQGEIFHQVMKEMEILETLGCSHDGILLLDFYESHPYW